MYVIEEDDYAQTSIPREDSDGAVKLFWDHPDHPGIWSGQCCDHFPYDDWSEIRPLTDRTSFGVWSWFHILLLRFNLVDREDFISFKEILELSPADLRGLRERIHEATDFTNVCRVILPDFVTINDELIAYFAHHPDALQSLHWRKFEELLDAIFKNQGFNTTLGYGTNDQGIDLRLVHKDSIGEMITLVQAKRYAPTAPIELEAVSALYGGYNLRMLNEVFSLLPHDIFPQQSVLRTGSAVG